MIKFVIMFTICLLSFKFSVAQRKNIGTAVFHFDICTKIGQPDSTYFSYDKSFFYKKMGVSFNENKERLEKVERKPFDDKMATWFYTKSGKFRTVYALVEKDGSSGLVLWKSFYSNDIIVLTSSYTLK